MKEYEYQHLRVGRVYRGTGLHLSMKYGWAKYGHWSMIDWPDGENALKLVLSTEKYKDGKRGNRFNTQTGNIIIPVRYQIAEYYSIEQSLTEKNTFYLRAATDTQIINEYAPRVTKVSTGWIQKGHQLTIDKDTVAYLKQFGDRIYFTVFDRVLQVEAFDQKPEGRWRDATHALEKYAFRIPSKYIRRFGLLTYSRMEYKEQNGAFFFTPARKVDVLDGRPIRDMKKAVRIYLSQQGFTAAEHARQYLSRTDENLPFTQRINQAINKMLEDQAVMEELLNDSNFQEILRRENINQ